MMIHGSCYALRGPTARHSGASGRPGARPLWIFPASANEAACSTPYDSLACAPGDLELSRFINNKDTLLAIADLIPSLTDVELVNLKNNALRLSESGTPAQMAAAVEITPLIEAEMAERLARKPPKAKPVRRKKAAVEAEAEEDADAEAEAAL